MPAVDYSPGKTLQEGYNPALCPRPQDGSEVVRGTINVPLSEMGVQLACEVGRKIKRKGGISGPAYCSSLMRAIQTLDCVRRYNSGIKPQEYTKQLWTWPLGGYECWPDSEFHPVKRNIVRSRPDAIPPGRSPASTAPGMSLNAWAHMSLDYIRSLLRRFAVDKDRQCLVVTHSTTIALWRACDLEDDNDYSINAEVFLKKGGDPADLSVISGSKLTLVNLDSLDRLGNGFYVLRHSITDLNEENKAA